MEAWQTAKEAREKWLVVTDGSTEAGMRRIGTERFEAWVLKVEAALEKINPKDQSAPSPSSSAITSAAAASALRERSQNSSAPGPPGEDQNARRLAGTRKKAVMIL